MLITYSPAYTLVPTYECFNRCAYCNFRQNPGESLGLTEDEARRQLLSLQSRGVIEILILSGEVHPESPRRRQWFERIYGLCELAISLGFLPHTNAGILKWEEMAQLREVNVSMGLMLEQLTPRLLGTVHQYAPSKLPELRLQQLAWAGELKIAFTTGILLGIGETEGEQIKTLEAIAQVQERWHHIQEVILQPYSPGRQQTGTLAGYPLERLPALVALARQVLPATITLQVPPNLVRYPDILLGCLEGGAGDLGGICPKDEVNPDYPHPDLVELSSFLRKGGWELHGRLPIYPQYDRWLNPRLQARVREYRQGLVRD